MAMTGSSLYTRSTRTGRTRTTRTTQRTVLRRYRWPALQLNVFLVLALISACVVMGIFAYFIAVQCRLKLGVPW